MNPAPSSDGERFSLPDLSVSRSFKHTLFSSHNCGVKSRVGDVENTGQMGNEADVEAAGQKVPMRNDSSATMVASAEDHASFDHQQSKEHSGMSCVTVGFEEGDPHNPKNWSMRYRLWITALGIIIVFNCTLASTSASGVSINIQYAFKVPIIVETLVTSLFLVGYIVGPIVFSPSSEFFGRKPTSVVAFTGYTIFSVATALSPNIAAMLVFRFLTGFFAACPLSVVGAIYADIYGNPMHRGIAIATMAFITMGGPVLSPSISGFIATSYLSWRWAFWIPAILAGATLILLVTTYKETYPPVLLARKAKRLSEETGIKHVSELDNGRELRVMLKNAFTRPMRLVLEPIVFSISIYLSFMYGMFYGFFLAYPIIFEGLYQFKSGPAGLMFIPVGVGSFIAWLSAISHLTYQNNKQKNHHKTFTPETARLPLSCVAGPCFVVALLILGWTSRPSVSYFIPSIFGGVLFGFGFTVLFISFFNYLADIYGLYAASALGVTSILRSSFGAAMPLFIPQMYHALSIPWATTLLAGVSLLLCPLPFLFIKFGERLRARSTFIQHG